MKFEYIILNLPTGFHYFLNLPKRQSKEGRLFVFPNSGVAIPCAPQVRRHRRAVLGSASLGLPGVWQERCLLCGLASSPASAERSTCRSPLPRKSGCLCPEWPMACMTQLLGLGSPNEGPSPSESTRTLRRPRRRPPLLSRPTRVRTLCLCRAATARFLRHVTLDAFGT